MEEQVLSIEQMKELENLGIDTNCGSMYWHNYNTEDDPQWELCSSADVGDITTFTLQDVLDKLPKVWEIGVYNINRYTITVFLDHELGNCHQEVSDSLLEAAFRMLRYLKQNNYI